MFKSTDQIYIVYILIYLNKYEQLKMVGQGTTRENRHNHIVYHIRVRSFFFKFRIFKYKNKKLTDRFAGYHFTGLYIYYTLPIEYALRGAVPAGHVTTTGGAIVRIITRDSRQTEKKKDSGTQNKKKKKKTEWVIFSRLNF